MISISEKELKELQLNHEKKLLIADVRTPEEFNLQHIEWAENLPLDTFNDHIALLKQYDVVVCYCNSGNSSSQFCKRAEWQWMKHVMNFAWGLPACKSCSVITKKWPLPMMQQVQVVAWSLVLLGIALAKWFHIYPWHEYFIILSAFVGAGLLFAGLSGRCWMAKLLAKMPRNKIKGSEHKTEIYGDNLIIKQFEDKNLAHYSYIAISNNEAIVVDPERNPHKYYEYAALHNAKIIGVLNTHPHADFASGHLQIRKDTGATIYVWWKVWAEYEHVALEWGEVVSFGSSSFEAYFTPWHSPDSISYLIKDSWGRQIAMYTGDRVFIGDVWRADLREMVGNIKAKQEELAGMMYDSTRSVLRQLDGSLMLLPAHGAGTSCGKGLSKMNMATLEHQLKYNPMLQEMSRAEFINELTSEQPSIPAYFTNSVLLNKKWNDSYTDSHKLIHELTSIPDWATIIDTRSREQSENYPLSTKYISIPLHNTGFVGMLGATIRPDEKYALILEKGGDKEMLLGAILSIGYEKNCLWVFIIEKNGYHKFVIHKQDIEKSADYLVLDVRSEYAFMSNPMFAHTINIPIEQLRNRLGELDKEKVHIPYCGWSYKSDIAISVLQSNGYKVKKMYP